jgi:ketosteroid isomerase-like protein
VPTTPRVPTKRPTSLGRFVVSLAFPEAHAATATRRSKRTAWPRCTWPTPRDTARAMSQENVEIVRRGYEAFNRGDWDAALEVADPEIEWRLHGELALDVQQTVRGREALKNLWASFFDAWDDYNMGLLDLIEAPDGRLLATVHFTAVGLGSTVPIDLTYFWLYLVRDGAIATVDIYLDRAEALEAAGLSE